MGHEVVFVTPERFRTLPCPSYPEISLAIGAGRRMAKIIEAARPCAIHIATERPLGLAARRHCLRRALPFTTAYHTRFPEYVRTRWRVPLTWTYAYMRWFHRPSRAIMVATPSIEGALARRGFANLRRWSRGTDLSLFRPRDKSFVDCPRPLMLYVGRVAVEKNLEPFLSVSRPGTKMVIGDGPALSELKRRHPDVVFAGAKSGEDLARHFAAADVFVFPSRTDTFGLVILEALASGVPVAAYPVEGPLDVIGDSGAGCLDEDLGRAIDGALPIQPERCRQHALTFTWENSARQFLGNLSPFAFPDTVDDEWLLASPWSLS